MIPEPATPEEARRFLERLWNLENGERPGFLVGYTGPEVVGGEPVVSALFSTEGAETVRERLLDPRRYLEAQRREMAGQARLFHDYVPALCPSLGVVAIPSAFGCEVVWWEKDFPAVKPIILDHAERVWDLEPPSVTDGVLGRILDYVRFFREAGDGADPIRITDLQGPLDNAALIFGHNDFLLALSTHPREVHRLLELITDLTIRFVRAMEETAGDGFVPSLFQPWMPRGKGVSVSNDECVMISAGMHDAFAVPYLNRLSETFGGIFVHSCGNWLHQLPSMEKVRGLRGVEFGASETPFPQVAERLGGRTVIACRLGLNRDRPFRGMADYLGHVLRHKTANEGLFIHLDATNAILGPRWPATDLHQLYAMLGYS